MTALEVAGCVTGGVLLGAAATFAYLLAGLAAASRAVGHAIGSFVTGGEQ